MDDLPQRRRLSHAVPDWVNGSALYFVTVCAQPRHKNQLCQPAVGAELLRSAGCYHEMQRWWLRLILLMPDHLHALMAVPKGESLPEIVRGWKSYQTKKHGINWQAGFFDHRLRSGESEQQRTDYILMNPVRAGLAVSPEEWPYYWPKSYTEFMARRDDLPYR